MSSPIKSAVTIEQVIRLAQELPRIIELLKSIGAMFGLFGKKTPVPAPDAPPAPPVVVPNAPSIPQVPIQPLARVASIRTVLQNVERPDRAGGGHDPITGVRITYEDARGMSARGEAFNYGCVAFLDSTAFDGDGDEFTGGSRGKLVANNLEFKGKWRIKKDGVLVAAIEGTGDDNPTGEGKPLPWHEARSAGVGFGQGKWMASAGMGIRVVFEGEGDFTIEFELDDITGPVIPFRVS